MHNFDSGFVYVDPVCFVVAIFLVCFWVILAGIMLLFKFIESINFVLKPAIIMAKNSHRCFETACANNVHVNPDVFVFRLSRAPEKLMKWLSAVSKFAAGIPSISDPNEALTYSSKFICANHFIDSDFVNEKKEKLNHHVLPSVFDAALASSLSLKVTTESVVQPSVFQYQTTLSPSSPHVLPVKHAYSKISTLPNVEKSTNSDSFNAFVNNSMFLPSTSSTPVRPPKARCRLQMTDPVMCSTSRDEVSEELAVQLIDTTVESVQTPLYVKSKKCTGTTLLKTYGVSRMSMLTPKKQKILRQVQGKVKAMKRVCKQLRKQNLTFRETVDKAADLQLRELKNMSPAAYHLLASQLRFKNMKPQGRRWTVDEKILAISIYKRSPSCYSLLRRMLVLPSKKSLLNLLNAVPFKCGVDNRVMLLIKEIVSSL
ncbi:uncharacterized protein LOC134529730 [Bacillus rossius redtenbacheri]|uniref:uncharacterized protein LOC134529730 n=1 Tax=Bacillus rossius redtenbacheri TaxID=93214 RepID=UPI002FDEA35B